MNTVGTSPQNVRVSGGVASLRLSNAHMGALIHTTQAPGRPTLPVGGVVEARIWFPGNGSQLYNWPAFWANDTDNYPSGGENDIAEVLTPGMLTVNYHSPSGTHNQGGVPGRWSNSWHTYALHRLADHCDVYWDGVLVKSYRTDDNGSPEDIIFNVGAGTGPTMVGAAGALRIDYVRIWSPQG
ncbi:MAG: glycoside hydrolase family 16 protein [Mycobacteriales bacterium]